ncbi:MAG TPA: hypothetical protein VF192_03255 [Longimicrobiales bacterium]
MNPDGTGLREVWRARSPGPGERPTGASNPSFSPDGCRVVFQATQPGKSSPGIYTLDLRTGLERRYVDRGSGTPVWSPDGKRIAFSGLTATGFEIFTVDVETGELARHTELHAPSAISSDFFPDSRSLAIARLFDENGTRTSDLYRLELETGKLTPLFARPNLDELAPAVALDGRSIAFYGQSPSVSATTEFIYVVGPDGVARQVTPVVRGAPSRQAPEGILATASHPAFSPDGQWLVFTWTRDRRLVRVERDGETREIENTLGELYVSRVDGSFPVRVTHFAGAFQPDWGPVCPDVIPNP